MRNFRKILVVFAMILFLQGLAAKSVFAQYTTGPVNVWGSRPSNFYFTYTYIPTWYGSSSAHHSAPGPVYRDIANPENGPPGGWGTVKCNYFFSCNIPIPELTCSNCEWYIPGCTVPVQSTGSDHLSGTVETEVDEGLPCAPQYVPIGAKKNIVNSTIRRDYYEKNGEVCGEWRHNTFTVVNTTRECPY